MLSYPAKPIVFKTLIPISQTNKIMTAIRVVVPRKLHQPDVTIDLAVVPIEGAIPTTNPYSRRRNE